MLMTVSEEVENELSVTPTHTELEDKSDIRPRATSGQCHRKGSGQVQGSLKLRKLICRGGDHRRLSG